MPPRQKGKPLTAKEEMFCYEYIKDLNAQAAARRTGYSISNKKTYAEMLKRPEVKKLVTRLLDEKKEACKMDAAAIMEEVAAIAKADIHQYIKIEKCKILDDVEVDQVTLRDFSTVDTRAINSIKQGKDGISFKMNDKVKALDMLGRHFGLWKEGETGDIGALGNLLITHMNKRLEAGEKKESGKQADE